jgi:hypothetical protein
MIFNLSKEGLNPSFGIGKITEKTSFIGSGDSSRKKDIVIFGLERVF